MDDGPAGGATSYTRCIGGEANAKYRAKNETLLTIDQNISLMTRFVSASNLVEIDLLAAWSEGDFEMTAFSRNATATIRLNIMVYSTVLASSKF